MIPQFTNSRAIELAAAKEFLRGIAQGGSATYDEIRRAVGIDPRKERHIIAKAREFLRDDGYVFRAEPNIGLRRLTDAEIATEVPSQRSSRIRNQARFGLSELRAIENFQGLSSAEQIQASIGKGVFAAMGVMAGAKAFRLLRRVVVERPSDELPVSRILEAFQGIN